MLRCRGRDKRKFGTGLGYATEGPEWVLIYDKYGNHA
jgi:hypothetical protein